MGVVFWLVTCTIIFRGSLGALYVCIFDYSRTTSGNKSRNMTFLMHLRQCHNKLITFIFNLKQAKPFPKTL